jgi:hypothetical protein
MQVVMTRGTEHKSLSLSGCHITHPARSLLASFEFEIFEFTNVMDFYILLRATEFADFSRETD